jgi:hypothetical protein
MYVILSGVSICAPGANTYVVEEPALSLPKGSLWPQLAPVGVSIPALSLVIDHDNQISELTHVTLFLLHGDA